MNTVLRIHKKIHRLLAAASIVVLSMGMGSSPVSAGKPDNSMQATDTSNLRFVLFRSYLPNGGDFSSIQLPTISVIRNGVTTPLPVCPWRELGDPPEFPDVEQHFKKDPVDLARVLRKIAKGAGVIQNDVAPYCSWWFVLDNNVFNIAYPDAEARYWGTPFIADDDTQIQIDGVYGDQRYMSLTVYNSDLDFFNYTNQDGTTFPSNLSDYQIDPVTAGLNPYQDLSGSVDAAYSVTIKPDPQTGESNVLPASPNLSPAPEPVKTGGALPLPCNAKGNLSACSTPNVFSHPPSGDQSGFFANPNNAYIATLIDLRVPKLSTLQGNLVYVIRGKLPKTPPGETPVVWPNDDFNLRYWSICTGPYTRPYATTRGDHACVADNAIVRTDADGVITEEGEYFTVVVSTPSARPEILTGDPQLDGVNWLEGDAFVRTIILLRNMLPNENFLQAAQNVPENGSWISAFNTMQEFYPAITAQCTKEHFDVYGWGGCVAPVIEGTHPVNIEIPPGTGIPGTPGSRQ